MNTFPVTIIEAERTFYEGPCEMLIIPCVDGLVGIEAKHLNMISAIVPGTMTYRLPGQENKVAAVSNGMLKCEDGEVMVLCESIERPEEIDVRRAEREEAAARERLLQKRSVREYRLAQLELARTANRLKVKRKYGGM